MSLYPGSVILIYRRNRKEKYFGFISIPSGKSELWGLAGWKVYMVDEYYEKLALCIIFYPTSNLQLDILSQIQISNSIYFYRFYNLQRIWKGCFGLGWSLVRILVRIIIIWSYHTPSTRTRQRDRGCLKGEAVMTARDFSQFSHHFFPRIILLCLYREPQPKKPRRPQTTGPKPHQLKTTTPKTQYKTPTPKPKPP